MRIHNFARSAIGLEQRVKRADRYAERLIHNRSDDGMSKDMYQESEQFCRMTCSAKTRSSLTSTGSTSWSQWRPPSLRAECAKVVNLASWSDDSRFRSRAARAHSDGDRGDAGIEALKPSEQMRRATRIVEDLALVTGFRKPITHAPP